MTPIEMAALADQYATARADRLNLQHDVDALKEEETMLFNMLVAGMSESEVSSIGGQSALITYRKKPKAVAKNWPLIHEYVLRTGDFGVYENRLGQKHIMMLKEDGIAIPGTEWFDVDTLSVAKAKK